MPKPSASSYTAIAREAIADPVLQGALANLQARFGRGTAEAYRNLPEGPDLRLEAHALRRRTIDNLDVVLAELTANVRKNGGRVFFADDAQAAIDYCLSVARRHRVRRIVKGKSMVTEEIGLNRALLAAGIEVTETDLGEYIVQLADEHPSHIIAPAIHKTRREIGALFADKLGTAYSEDPPTLTRDARQALRTHFLEADMGLSGCNLACAETGHITTVSNEGNIRMSSTLPKVHMAFMGMERVAARLEEHDILLRLLARGAAAQNMPTYVSYVGGPAQDGQADGPREFHLVILDNGRSRILADPQLREILCCIRCAACLNVCPVYGEIGGYAYGFAYSGPVGAVVTPLLTDMRHARDLCFGETLCGACQDACAVAIDIPGLLLTLRHKLAEGDTAWGVAPHDRREKAFYRLWSEVIGRRRVYDLLLRLAGLGQRILPRRQGMIRRMPGPLAAWTRSRDLKAVAGESFNAFWRRTRGGPGT